MWSHFFIVALVAVNLFGVAVFAGGFFMGVRFVVGPFVGVIEAFMSFLALYRVLKPKFLF